MATTVSVRLVRRPGRWAGRAILLAVASCGAGWCGGGSCREAGAVTLVSKDGPPPAICVAPDAAPEVAEAADELARVLGAMTGRPLAVTKAVEPPPGPAILLDALAARAGLRMEKTSRAGDGYRYKVDGNRLLLVGESPRGIFLGATSLLESLGCGWFAPGPLGEVIPARETVSLADGLDHTGISNSISRRYWYGGKNGVGEKTTLWLRRLNGDLSTGSWNHAYSSLINREKLLESHPEYFSLNSDKAGGMKRLGKQLCTTNPETVSVAAETLCGRMAGTAEKNRSELLVFAAGPNDGGGLCECESCTKLDTPGYLEPSSGKPSCSDRTFTFADELASITSRRFPDRDLGVLVYSEYSRVPVTIKKLHPNVFPMVAPIRRCRLHGPGNPNCVWGKMFADEISGWCGVTNGKLGFYIYNYNLADSLLPLGKVQFYKDLVREVNRLEVPQLAWIFETIDSWSMHAPSMYLSVRLSWDSRIDIDREMDRFYAGFYGEAAGPMRDYWTRIDQAYAETPVCTGSSYGQHRIWTPKMLAASRDDIEKSKALAASGRVKEAVAMAEAGLVCAERFMQVWNAIGVCDFAAAARARDGLVAHVKSMAERTEEPNWVHQRYAVDQYFNRFIGRTVDGGAKALADGGAIVVRLPDEWKFAKDEKGVGAREGWQNVDYDDGGWGTLRTFSRSWSDQGLATYQGDGWYRATVTVPAEAKGPAGGKANDLRLWFGGFDNNVDVYVNGRHLGEKTGFATPAEFAGLAELLTFGGPNTIAVRVSAGSLAELGTGGIMMPVMIYRASGKAAEPGKKDGDTKNDTGKPPVYDL
ncbi:MAG: DUF4838 domain-containing protein [Planctomycetia bacterium]|nr:DUF4838 domain-containing protein [Planctomycetia bacterium]